MIWRRYSNPPTYTVVISHDEYQRRRGKGKKGVWRDKERVREGEREKNILLIRKSQGPKSWTKVILGF